MTTIAVVGPGAIGGTIAARLIDNGRQVTVCSRSPLTELIVESPQGVRTVTPATLTSPNDAAPVDWVFIATKAHDSASTAGWIRSLVRPATRVAILQNGVEHVERFAPYVPASQIVPIIVEMPIERVARGRFRQRGNCRLTVAMGPDGRRFSDLFAGTSITVSITENFRTDAWRKLALNCAGALSALILKPAGIVRSDAAAEIMRTLVRECIAVGQKEGAIIDETLVEQIIEKYRNGPPDAINSMHADRIAGRTLEVDARNGAVVRFGRKHGIPTPVNRIIVTLLQLAGEPVPGP